MAYLRAKSKSGQPGELGQPNTSLSNTENSTIQGTSSQTGTPSPNKTSNFVDMNTYLKNNEKQINEFADKSTSGIVNKANTIESNISDADSRFKQSVAKDTFTEDKSWLDNIFNDPSKFTKEKPNVDRFHTIRDDKWSGDTSLEDQLSGYETRKDIDYVDDRAEAFQSREGREGILKEQNKGTRYSPNLSKLDGALLQSSDTARNTFIDRGKNIQNKDLLGNLIGKEVDANNLYRDTKKKNTEFSTEAKSRFNPTYTDHKNQLTGYANEVNKNAKNRDDWATGMNMQSQPVWVPDYNYSDANGSTGTWVNMPNAVNPFELGDPMGDQEFKNKLNSQLGVDNKAYDIMRNRDSANINTVSTQEDLAKLQALNELGGEEFAQDYLDPNAYRNRSLRNFGDKTNPNLWDQIMAIDTNRRYSPSNY
ncbi:hypothetical protein [Leptospira bandrabouensis]|uniref:hypothetical protein n=1 Tax=Leptospira bandrabouensis TaxID=2484903 RepID=UPI0010917098|nr:hypothetical protein [Leptospira bandrabouensis]TGN09985.1 hypothetical protein EHR07_00465 [Leptospira bandrabouensis]